MKSSLIQSAAQYAQKRRRKRLWYRAVSGLACVVVFCTVYALILPAITLSWNNPRLEAEKTEAAAAETAAKPARAEPEEAAAGQVEETKASD